MTLWCPVAERRPISRLVVPAVTAVVFAALYLLHGTGNEVLYRAALLRWGVIPFTFPFVDTHFVLSSLECAHRSIDVYAHNPCDALGRLFNYSPALLWARELNVTTADTPTAGLALDGLFLVSLTALPTPRNFGDVGLMMFATLSTMTAFAVERANLDLLTFVLVVIVARLLLCGPVARYLAYGAVGLAALIKFYPAVLLVLTMRERPRIFFAINAVIVTALAVFAFMYRAELALVFANLPKRVYFTDMFGAANLPFGMAALFSGVMPLPFLVALTVLTLAFAIWLACRREFDAVWTITRRSEGIFLLIGCALIFGCFFAGGSIGYRGVFLILVLPGFLAISRRSDTATMRALFSATVFLIVFVMWGEFFRVAIAASGASPWADFSFWVIRELVWWWIIAIMGALLARFAFDSEIVRNFVPWQLLRLKPERVE